MGGFGIMWEHLLSLGKRVKVVSVERSKRELEAFALRYGIENVKEILDYDRTLGCEGIAYFDPDPNNEIVIVKLDTWEGEIAFYTSELEEIVERESEV